MPTPKNDTTAVDSYKSQFSATDAEVAAFDLDRHLVRLMWDEPFYSKVLRGITKRRTESIGTAGVAVVDGDVKFLWNPRFVASLEKDEGPDKVGGLSIHECLHLVYMHCTKRRRSPHLMWNYATDLAINCQIPEEKLPSCGIWPGKEFKAVPADVRERIGDDRADKWEALSRLLESFPPMLSAEEYFKMLMEDENATDLLNPPPGEGQPGQPGEGEGEGQPGEGEGGGNGLPGPMDDHDGWGEMSEEDRQMVEATVRQAVEDAVKECDSKGSWGSVGAEARADIRAMISREIPWEKVLKQFVGLSRRANRQTSRMRLNKKYPGIHSGFKRSYTASIAVYIDQSGSVSNEDLELLFGELGNLAKTTEFTTFHFDTEVDEDSETNWRGGRIPAPHRTRCGGTCFDAPIAHANKNKHRFDGILILTDGYAPKPSVPCRLRRGWVITPGDAVESWMTSPRDFVIAMKERAAKAA